MTTGGDERKAGQQEPEQMDCANAVARADTGNTPPRDSDRTAQQDPRIEPRRRRLRVLPRDREGFLWALQQLAAEHAAKHPNPPAAGVDAPGTAM